MNNDEWFIIKDLDGFINSSRALVFNNFGSNKDSTDDLKLEINKEDQDELNNILSFDESRIILMSLIKKQKNKKTGQQRVAIFCAAALANLFTYITTSIQLALAFPALDGGFMASFIKFAGIFALTQIPLAISEGLLTLLVWNWLESYGKKELETIKLLQG